MSYFVYTYDGCSNGCDIYRIQPDFTPRRVESRPAFDSLLTAAASQRSADQLTAGQKEVLRKRLNNGQGALTLQQWDDYLADLEELGMISHDDRFYANGIMQQIPEASRGLSGAESIHDAKDRYWNGDPLQWLRDMGRISTALSSQRSAYQKVENITRDILGPGGDNFMPRTSTINANQFRSAWLQSRTTPQRGIPHMSGAEITRLLYKHIVPFDEADRTPMNKKGDDYKMNICGFTAPRPAAANNLRTSTRLGKGNFSTQLTSARMAPASTARDTVSVSSRSFSERLDELRKTHEDTDYSGMSDKDIAHLINARFREAFPEYGKIMCGVYPRNEELIKEESRQFMEANKGKGVAYEKGEWWNLKRYIHGYDGMTDEEILAEVQRRYPTDSLADKCAATWELYNVGIVGLKAADTIMMHIYTEIDHATSQYMDLDLDNPIRVNAEVSYAENHHANWTQLVHSIMEERSSWTYDTEHDRQRVLRELDQCLNDFLEQMGLARTKFL